MRHLLFAAVGFATLLVSAPSADAQDGYRIAATGCVRPGQTLAITGRFPTSVPGEIVLVDQRKLVEAKVTQWTPQRVRIRLPSARALTAGRRYAVELRQRNRVLARMGTITLCAASGPVRRASNDELPAPDGTPEYVVSVTQGQAGAALGALQAQGATLLRTRQLGSLGRTLLVVALPPGLSVAQAQAALDAAVNGAQIDVHNLYGYAAGPRLYAAAAIGDPEGRACTLRRAVRVGLIDGPVNSRHKALSGVKVSQVSVLGKREKPPSADHGTAVAALIGGGQGAGPMAGFAPGAQIFAASAFTRRRGGESASLENVSAGLDWLTGNKVRLVNLSFAGRPNRALGDVLSAAARSGMVMVAASGNSGKDYPAYPAGHSRVIAVTAVDASGKLYRRANRGKHIEFAAPGVDVYTAKGGGGGYQTGTSFASPIVTALLARKAAAGRLSLDGARAALRRGVRDLGPAGRDTNFGYGLVRSGGC